MPVTALVVKQRAESYLEKQGITRNEITEQEWRDTIYKIWTVILEEENRKLVSVYSVLAKELYK